MQSTSAVKGTPLVACRSRVQARSGRRMQVGDIMHGYIPLHRTHISPSSTARRVATAAAC